MVSSDAQEEFDRLFESSKRPLVGQAYLLTGDLQDAQDLAQEAFLRAWKNWGRVRTLDDPQGWVRRVLYNLAVSHLRRRRTRRTHERSAVSGVVPAADAGHLELLAAVRALPANQRQAVVLSAVVGLSISEIATELGAGEGTVRVWLSRARATIGAS